MFRIFPVAQFRGHGNDSLMLVVSQSYENMDDTRLGLLRTQPHAQG
jgi:hypothetical protein